MINLTERDSELVSLGAAMGANCAPCIEFHVPKARKAGLSELEIEAAIKLADKVRQVPAKKTLQTAMVCLGRADENAKEEGCGCG